MLILLILFAQCSVFAESVAPSSLSGCTRSWGCRFVSQAQEGLLLPAPGAAEAAREESAQIRLQSLGSHRGSSSHGDVRPAGGLKSCRPLRAKDCRKRRSLAGPLDLLLLPLQHLQWLQIQLLGWLKTSEQIIHVSSTLVFKKRLT